ncbi:MAG: hypothetical protein HY836_17810 [Aquabacterium sp.]|uniref:hypothetical protein n=1 Tax=Aquabacterium sp. TaxID=1872578 RepID=UPI0025BFBBCF|nr:hypothetical protein [Aquabacterium sp.]MBI5927445.1 hypothetical protein [Aquabacterium sp.]
MWGPRTFIRKRLDAFARQFNYDMAYTHQILDAGLKPFKAFSCLFTLAAYRHPQMPLAPWFAVKWVATHSEDCGPCQQLTINMARQQGVPLEVIKAITRGDLKGMGSDTALAYQWAHAVIRPDSQEANTNAMRQHIKARWGEQGLISLTLAMAGARSFPMVKRALGHNQDCQILDYGDQ